VELEAFGRLWAAVLQGSGATGQPQFIQQQQEADCCKEVLLLLLLLLMVALMMVAVRMVQAAAGKRQQQVLTGVLPAVAAAALALHQSGCRKMLLRHMLDISSSSSRRLAPVLAAA
jgi:hypothetical protein